jgi:transcriptional regulator with XRE-family HTH domain
VSEELSATVRSRVQHLLAERGWTGRELARRTGIHQASLSRKLAGTVKFDLDDLPRLAAAFEVTTADLVG